MYELEWTTKIAEKTTGTESMPVLIIGNRGQLGRALEHEAAAKGIITRGADLPELDLTNREAVHRIVGGGDRFSAVVNAAAYTAVDKAESDIDTAFAVNRDGAAHLADACRDKAIPLIHISTDYVFNGKSKVPYKAEDPIDPLGVYGRSKADGENEVRRRITQHIIIRTSWLYGIHGNNFVKTMLRLAKEKKILRVVDDQKGCPTFADDLAGAIVKLIELLKSHHHLKWGIYHYCNTGITSWYSFAKKAIELASEYETLMVERVVPITTADYPTPAPRPVFSALDCGSLETNFGIEINSWETSLKKMIAFLYMAE